MLIIKLIIYKLAYLVDNNFKFRKKTIIIKIIVTTQPQPPEGGTWEVGGLSICFFI